MVTPSFHPAIRLATFLVFALMLTRPTTAQLVVGLLLLLSVSMYLPWACTHQALQRLWRLRWLFFSIFMVFALMTPGQSLFGEAGGQWLTREGLVGGIKQCVMLVLIVMAVNVLLFTTPREALLQGLRWWLAPLGLLGLQRDHVALRIMLVLSVVPKVQDIVREQLAAQSLRKFNFAAAGMIAANLFNKVEKCAEHDHGTKLQVPAISHPAWWQWSWPLILLVGLLAVRWFNPDLLP